MRYPPPIMASAKSRNPDNPSDRKTPCNGCFCQYLEIANHPEISNTLTTVQKDSLVVLPKQEINTMEKKPNKERKFAPLPEELRGVDFEIRKLTPRECFRLMDVDEPYIDKMLTPTVTTKSGKIKPLISDSKLYQLAGNSIVVACMEGIFENLLYPAEDNAAGRQLSLF